MSNAIVKCKICKKHFEAEDTGSAIIKVMVHVHTTHGVQKLVCYKILNEQADITERAYKSNSKTT